MKFSPLVLFIASPRPSFNLYLRISFYLRNEGIFIFAREGFMTFIQTQLYYKTLFYLLLFSWSQFIPLIMCVFSFFPFYYVFILFLFFGFPFLYIICLSFLLFYTFPAFLFYFYFSHLIPYLFIYLFFPLFSYFILRFSLPSVVGFCSTILFNLVNKCRAY